MAGARHLCVAAAVGASACAISHEPYIVSIPQSSVRAALTLDEIGDYRTAAVTIASIFDRQLGIPRFPATLEFYPHTDAFEKRCFELATTRIWLDRRPRG